MSTSVRLRRATFCQAEERIRKLIDSNAERCSTMYGVIDAQTIQALEWARVTLIMYYSQRPGAELVDRSDEVRGR